MIPGGGGGTHKHLLRRRELLDTLSAPFNSRRSDPKNSAHVKDNFGANCFFCFVSHRRQVRIIGPPDGTAAQGSLLQLARTSQRGGEAEVSQSLEGASGPPPESAGAAIVAAALGSNRDYRLQITYYRMFIAIETKVTTG